MYLDQLDGNDSYCIYVFFYDLYFVYNNVERTAFCDTRNVRSSI